MSLSSPPFVLHLDHGSLSFGLPVEAAQSLQREVESVLDRFKTAAKATAGAPPAAAKSVQTPLDYRYRGEVKLEVFGNPNIWPSPHAARLLITVKTDQIKISTEADLTRLMEDLTQYLESL